MHFVVEVVDAEAVGNIALNQSNKAEVTSFAELSAPPFACDMDRIRRGLVDLDMYSRVFRLPSFCAFGSRWPGLTLQSLVQRLTFDQGVIPLRGSGGVVGLHVWHT